MTIITLTLVMDATGDEIMNLDGVEQEEIYILMTPESQLEEMERRLTLMKIEMMAMTKMMTDDHQVVLLRQAISEQVEPQMVQTHDQLNEEMVSKRV